MESNEDIVEMSFSTVVSKMKRLHAGRAGYRVTAIAEPDLLALAPKSVPTVTPEEMQTALARVRQSAILEERNRLAGDIHDGLAQNFTAICMQLQAAKEELSSTPN